MQTHHTHHTTSGHIASHQPYSHHHNQQTPHNQISLVVITSTLIVFIWFDICLYHSIQSLSSTSSGNKSDISVKQVMLDHLNVYVITPLTLWLADVTQIAARFPSLTPNTVSYLGVLVALISARVVVSESLNVRRFAVFIFQIRQILDSLDGIIARIRMGMNAKRHVSMFGTQGYVVDGVCDAIGFAAFLIAFYVCLVTTRYYSAHTSHTTAAYAPLKELESGSSTTCSAQNSSNGRWKVWRRWSASSRSRFMTCFAFGMQLLLSSVFWNRYIDRYHALLESSTYDSVRQMTELKSPMTWTLMWCWRVLDPHALIQCFLVSIWLDRALEFLYLFRSSGFAAVLTLALFTEVHTNALESRLAREVVVAVMSDNSIAV